MIVRENNCLGFGLNTSPWPGKPINSYNTSDLYLTHVDMVIRVHGGLGSKRPAHEFNGPVGQHLVHVHVALGAWPRLPDHQREMVIQLAQYHLYTRPGIIFYLVL